MCYMLYLSRGVHCKCSGRDKIIVDPDTNKIYTKRKARECSISLPGSSSHSKVTEIKYPTTGWGKTLAYQSGNEKAHKNSGKRMGSVDNHSVLTMHRK